MKKTILMAVCLSYSIVAFSVPGRVMSEIQYIPSIPTPCSTDQYGSAVVSLGDINGDFFGSAISDMGDINNDGITDIAVGAPGRVTGVTHGT